MSADNIRILNDRFRTTFSGGRVMMTDGINALSEATKAKIFDAVRTFSAFTADNDPYGEHDFGSLTVEGVGIFFKIDYYDLTLSAGSDDPADTSKTTRVLTIMLKEEY